MEILLVWYMGCRLGCCSVDAMNLPGNWAKERLNVAKIWKVGAKRWNERVERVEGSFLTQRRGVGERAQRRGFLFFTLGHGVSGGDYWSDGRGRQGCRRSQGLEAGAGF